METDLLLNVRTNGDTPIVDVSGDLDEFTCRELGDALRGLLADGEHRVVVNLAGVNYMDSAGLGTLIGGLRRLREAEGALALSGPNPQVARILSVTGLDKVLRMYDGEIAAIAGLDFARVAPRESSREV